MIKPISQQQDQIFNAPLPGIPPHLSEISKSLLSIINSATNSPMLMPSMLPMPANTPPPPPLPINPSGVLNFLPQQQQSHLITHIDAEQNSLSKGSLSSASSTISSSKPVSTNDDSLDSLLGLGNGDEQDLKKVRCRRRKPQKTTRMSSDQPASELNTQLPNFSHSVPSNNDSSIDPKLLIDNGNGLTNYPPTNHSQGITPQTVTNYNQPSPQTQSMDLSNHCVLTDSHNAFRNGDFSDLPLKLANNMRNDLNGFNENKIYPRDFNSIGRTMDFSNNKFNPLNTDDLVKKVEEIVKCSDINGSLERQHTIKPSDHQTPGEQQHITQLNLNNKENGINLPPQSITSLITAPAVAKNYDETKCNGNKHFAGNVEKNTEMERRKTPIIDNESIRNNEDTDDLPILPVAEAKLPDTQPLPNSTPKDDSSFEDIKANLQNIFADIEEDEKTTFEKTNSSINSDSNVDKSNGDRDLKDSEMENEANVSTNSEKQVKDSEKTEESAPSNNSDNKASESNNDKSKSSNSDEKMNGKNSAEQQEASSTSIAPANNGQQEKPSKSNRRPLKKKPLVRRNNGTNGKGKKKMIASGGGGGRENDTTKNSHNGKKGFTGKTDKSAKVREESALDISNRFRGPYIQIQKDGSEVVINAPIAEDDAEKQSKIKNTFVKHHDRNKVRGLHVSTLSNKYDADTRDTTWMCVFCKLGPHKYGLGDLFGPFILSTTSEDFQLSQIDPREDIFKNQRSKLDMVRCKDVYVTPSKNTVIPSVNSNNVSGLFFIIFKFTMIYIPICLKNLQLPSKKKRKFSEVETAANASTSGNAVASSSTSSLQPDIFYGMTKSISDSYEVWAHEDCVVWSSGVHIIGARIVGLEAAVWGSTRHQCVICLQYGAVLSCLKRGCTEVAHLPCAQRSQWQLNETEFKILCGNHKTITSTTTTSDDENLK